MKAAWYEKQGPAREILTVGEMPDPVPGAGEVRIRLAASGINPGDIKKRQDSFGYGMAYPRVIPHRDGAGQVDQVGTGVSPEWIGRPVWCYGAQSYRPFGGVHRVACRSSRSAAGQRLQGAGRMPWHTRHYGPPRRPRCRAGRRTHGLGARSGPLRRNVRRPVGAFRGSQRHRTIRSSAEETAARGAGAHEILRTDQEFSGRVRTLGLEGVDHIVEVAFGVNIEADQGRRGSPVSVYPSASRIQVGTKHFKEAWR